MKTIFKKIFIMFIFYSAIFINTVIADSGCTKIYESECNSSEEQKQIENDAKNSLSCKSCEKCIVEDDEYCVYNQCYFDKQYRILKTNLTPDENQENCLDNIYQNFKQDLEILCDRYSKEKNKLLEMIVNEKKCLKEQKNKVKDTKSDIKEKYKDYLSETKEVLNKCQRKTFKKFKKKQNKKIKAIKKYGAIYKFPCS